MVRKLHVCSHLDARLHNTAPLTLDCGMQSAVSSRHLWQTIRAIQVHATVSSSRDMNLQVTLNNKYATKMPPHKARTFSSVRMAVQYSGAFSSLSCLHRWRGWLCSRH